MRTTVTINDELLAEVKVMAARQHRTIGSVMEEALMRLVEEDKGRPTARERYRLPDFGFTSGLLPGVDLFDKEQVAELLGDNELPKGLRRAAP
jgi:Ribbon-helix-helix protein, copG family